MQSGKSLPLCAHSSLLSIVTLNCVAVLRANETCYMYPPVQILSYLEKYSIDNVPCLIVGETIRFVLDG